MELEKQVVSLELSKKLKELGVKQDSLFYWSFYDGGFSEKTPGIVFTDDANHGFEEDLISAFTVAELGNMLPEGMVYHTRIMNTIMGPRRIDFSYQELKSGQPQGNVWKGIMRADTEADARAKMLIHLLENKLI